MTLFSFASILATLLLLVAAPAQGLGHIFLVLVRKLRKRPTRFRWGSVGPFLVISATIGLFVLLILFGDTVLRGAPQSVQKAVIAIFFVFIVACLVIPVWYLVAAYRLTKSRFRIWSYVIALLSLTAMPFVATSINGFTVAANDLVSGRKLSDTFFDLDGHRFLVQSPNSSTCFRFLAGLNMPIGGDLSADGAVNDPINFWIDQTLSGAFFDGAEVFDCHLSNLANNPNDLGFSALIVFYRLFAEFILVSVVIWPFVPMIQRLRKNGSPQPG